MNASEDPTTIPVAAGRRRRGRGLASTRRETVAEEIARLQPLPGDILLFHHPERFRSRIISWFTRSPFYHVGIYAGDGQVIEARLPRVICRNLYWEKDAYQFLVVRAASVERAERALTWARQQLGRPYDLMSVLLLVVSRVLRRPALCRCADGRFICGNFVARAFEEAGVSLFEDRSTLDQILPSDYRRLLHRSPKRRRVGTKEGPPGWL